MTHKKRITWLVSSMLLVAVLISTANVGLASSAVSSPEVVAAFPAPIVKAVLPDRRAAPLQVNGDVTINSLSASSELLPLETWNVWKANDQKNYTCWSSNTHTSATYPEWIAYWFNQFYKVNYIKLRPRYITATLGFPVDFTVYYSDGSNWRSIYTYTAFPTPQRNDWIILRLPTTVPANGILVMATKLGYDGYNYVLQFAEVGAGYDSGFEYFTFMGNDRANLSTPPQNEIRGVGSSQFNPDKLANWNYDIRRPLIAAKSTPGPNRNIYAPSIVLNGSAWAIYFGGWDGSSDQYDRVSFLTSNDDFLTFSNHFLQIDHGSYDAVNNPFVQKIGVNQWLMYYTTFNWGSPNKPAYSTSTNGANWTPSSGTMSTRLTVDNHPYGWDSADVNGANVLYYENGTYHFYYSDFTGDSSENPYARPGVFYASSDNGTTYTYRTTITGQEKVVNDLKAFVFNGLKYYLLITTDLFKGAYLSVSNSPRSFDAATFLFKGMDADDRYMLSAGLVTSDSRLYGALYGGVINSTACCSGAIYAKWLQKKVIFENNYVRWGDIERGYGPNRIRLFLNTQVETGHFKVYDTDGTTLLYTSPEVTIRPGDIWNFTMQTP